MVKETLLYFHLAFRIKISDSSSTFHSAQSYLLQRLPALEHWIFNPKVAGGEISP
jgi:hypothetical protein